MITLIAELATNHGGNLDIAKRMIDDAAAAGANLVKTQAYDLAKLNPADPQADWLRQAHLTERDHEALKAHAASAGVRYFASVFDRKSAQFIGHLCDIIKLASSVDSSFGLNVRQIKSHAWAVPEHHEGWSMVTVPLYPTPLDCLSRVDLARAWGWSDHCVSLTGCQWALASQPQIEHVEVHMTTDYAARQCAWDKTPDQLRQLRDWCEDLETIRSGVSRTFRERWTA